MRSGIVGIKKGLGKGRNNEGKVVLKSKRGGVKNFIRKWSYDLRGTYIIDKEWNDKKKKRLGIVYELKSEVRSKNDISSNVLMSSKNVVGEIISNDKRSGSISLLREVGVGSSIFDIKGKYGMSSNSWCTVIMKSKGMVLVRLKSGKEKWMKEDTIVRRGVVGMSKAEVKNAGASRRRGKRPNVCRISERRCHSLI